MRLIDADRLLDRCVFYHLPNGRIAVPIIDVQHAPTVEPNPRWIPVTERMPEEDVAVLVSYRYKEGEGDTSHSNIAITSYGQMYFGGHKVGIQHWRAPFKYFHSNYEVVAWMPLPEPYRKEERDDKKAGCD